MTTSVPQLCESNTGDKLHLPNYTDHEMKDLLENPAAEAETLASSQKQQPGIHHH